MLWTYFHCWDHDVLLTISESSIIVWLRWEMRSCLFREQSLYTRFWCLNLGLDWVIHVLLHWHCCWGTHTHLFNGFFPGLPRWAVTRKVKPIWILLKQETVSGSGISWAICKSAPRSRQITTPAPHHSVFYRPDALPAAQPTVSKHWRQRTVAGEILPKNR